MYLCRVKLINNILNASDMANLSEQILNMRVGDVLVYGLDRLTSVRVLASQTGLVHKRRYCTRTDRKSRTVTVTRVE